MNCRKQTRPTVGAYIYSSEPVTQEPREGYVTDLLSTQFVMRETLDGLPMFRAYTDPWSYTKP